MRRPHGFTLIELLVVVGIIGILVALALPALSKARDAARTTLSTARCQQIALGLTLYTQGNKGFFPATAHSGVSWMEQIGLPATKTIADFSGDAAAFSDYEARLRACEKLVADPRAFVSPNDQSPFLRPDATDRRWTSYGLNGYFTYDHPPYYGITMDAVGAPSRVVLIAEYRQEDEGAAGPWEDHFVPQFFNDGVNYVSGTSNVGAFNPANPVPIGAFPYPHALGVLAEGPSFAGTIDFTEDAEAAWDTAQMKPNSTFDASRYGGRWLYGFADGHAGLVAWEEVFVWNNTAAPPAPNAFDPKGAK